MTDLLMQTIMDDGLNKQQDGKLVSVIIPCYKQAQFLKEAINSVISQSYHHFEILVVDDGSPDDVEEVTSQFAQVRLIRQLNQGAAEARNNGVSKSNGAYLIFLDADDILLPNALEVGTRFLEEHPGCAYVSGAVQLIDQKGNFLEVPPQPKIEIDHYKTLLRTNYIWTPGAVMYRRSVFDIGSGFDDKAGGAADYELNIRIARTHPIGCHDYIILKYRLHDANMSKNFAYMLESSVAVRRAEYKFIKHDRSLLRAWKEGIRIVQADVGEKLIKQVQEEMKTLGPAKAARMFFAVILKYYPLGLLKLVGRPIKRLFR